MHPVKPDRTTRFAWLNLRELRSYREPAYQGSAFACHLLPPLHKSDDEARQSTMSECNMRQG